MLHGPPGRVGVITAADNIKYPAINAFVRAFKQDDVQGVGNKSNQNDVKLKSHYAVSQRKCVQTATSIFQLADRRIAIPFVQAMAPPIIQHLVSNERSRHPDMTEFDLALTLECIKSVEVLMTSPNLEISTENSCQ